VVPELSDLICSNSLLYSLVIGRYFSDHFHRIVINTGAVFIFTIGYGQFLALKKTQNVKLDADTANKQRFKFNIRLTAFKNTVQMNTSLKILAFHVIKADTSFLLSLHNLDKIGVYFNNLTNQLVQGQTTWPVIRKYGHSFFIWGNSLFLYYTSIFLNLEDVLLES
jgi:hypothetical protein